MKDNLYFNVHYLYFDVHYCLFVVFSALSRRVGALYISCIIIIKQRLRERDR